MGDGSAADNAAERKSPTMCPSTISQSAAHRPASDRHSCRQRFDGFTLIEVMITVAIVAILASIAIPSYSEYLRRGQLPEAFTFLSDYRVKMEQYYQDNRNYGVAACVDTNTPTSWNFTPAARQYFDFTCDLAGATASGGRQGYTLTATGRAGRAIGHIYTLDSGNTKATLRFKDAVVADKQCWLVRGSEC
jgi:type IV pilus assembly protein PilE